MNDLMYQEFMGELSKLRTPFTHPYNYDPFRLYSTNHTTTDSVYTDRLLGWDYDKHNQLCEKHFGNQGQYWDNRDPEKIQAFLRDYLDDDQLVLTFVEQHCNASTGYPVWCLGFNSGDQS